MLIQQATDEVTRKIFDRAIAVHRALGPGLHEYVYDRSLTYELTASGLAVVSQKVINVEYGPLKFENAYRIDLLVEDSVIVELKSVDTILPIHKAQLLNYLRLLKKPTGLLINFNSVVIHQGIFRILNPL